jgi:hypothetical protein
MSIGSTELVILVLLLCVPAIAIAAENSDKCLNRSQFVSWVFGLMALAMILPYIIVAVFEPGLGSLVGFMLGTLLSYVLMQKTTQRVRDAGYKKGFTYLAIIPLLNVVLIVAMMFKNSSINDNSSIT